jgi:hypothetical protein
MSENNNFQEKEKVLKTEDKLLGKKTIRITNIIKSLEKDEPESDSDSSNNDMKKYKSLTSGKLNLKKATVSEDKWNPASYLNKKEEVKIPKYKPNLNSQADALLSLLPQPKKKAYDSNYDSYEKKQNKVFTYFILGI